jgi:hypothetical protein
MPYHFVQPPHSEREYLMNESKKENTRRGPSRQVGEAGQFCQGAKLFSAVL